MSWLTLGAGVLIGLVVAAVVFIVWVACGYYQGN